MPIYEYACDSCRTTFERKQKFSEEPVRQCPECGSPVRRVLYPAGIIFKGSGFYATDNRSSSGSTSSNGTSSNVTSDNSESKSSSESNKSKTAVAADE